MRKFCFIIIALLTATGSYAQCVIDTAAFAGSAGGFYPSSAHLPHVIQDSLYQQTVQGKIEDTISMGGFITYIVDSVRLDSIDGLPAGITWQKSANTLPGGGYGCVYFSGTTTALAGTYNTTAIGKIWAHVLISIPIIGINTNVDTSSYGSLNRMAGYNNFYLVVDSLPTPLSDTVGTRGRGVLCNGVTGGSATVTAYGGSSSAPYNYYWSNGATTYTINNLDTGTYWVTVTSGVDTATGTVTIIGENPIVLTATGDTVSPGVTGTVVTTISGGTPPFTYRWNNGDSTGDITGLNAGNYNVRVTDSLGCRARANATVDTIIIPPSGIADLNGVKPQISLYPNPVNSLLNVVIESPVTVNGKLEVLDITGKVVYSLPANVSTARYSQVIDVKAFSAAVYILQFTTGSEAVHERFVVTR